MILGMLFFDNAIVGLANSLQGSIGVSEGTSLWISSIIAAIVASVVCVGLLSLLLRYKGKIIRDNGLNIGFVHIPNLPGVGNFFKALHLPSPSFRFDLSGWKGITVAVGMVAVGFAAAFSLVIATTDDTPVWPEAGAVYALPNTNGEKLPPDVHDPSTRSQTLQINLGNGVRLDKLELSRLDLRKAGLDNSLYVQGVTGAQVNVGLITIRNSAAPTLDWSRINTGCLTLAGNVDGHTLAATVDSTIPKLVIDSDRGAGSYTASDSTVDRVIIKTNGGDATIGEILIDDVDASVGAWKWEHVNAGCIVMENTNQFGNGTGINTASAVFNDTVKARVITDNLVDTPISVK